jgi:hypothetical protein
MKSFQPKIIDTYEDFRIYWSSANSASVDQQIKLWQNSYMVKYPELLEKQIQNYEDEGLDWREVAKERVFPKLAELLPLMQEARENILAIYKSVTAEAYQKLKLNFDMILVIYVGVGCGAGWATRYEGRPAILFGLENLAECRWHTKGKLQGLTAHEIGHLAHMAWRNEWERFEEMEQDPSFQLYTEDFAQRCEHVILGKETWHQAQDNSWVSWCEMHEGWLAKEFLKRIEGRASVRDFFGSWFDIQGRKQTGCFLGHAFIRNLEKAYTMREIALLNIKKVKELVSRYLSSIAHKSAI